RAIVNCGRTLPPRDGLARVDPPPHPTLEVGDVAIAKLLQRSGAERRTTTRSAVKDDPPCGVEFRPVIGRRGIHIELEHPARSLDAPGDHPVRRPLFRLAEINQ